MKLNLRAHRPKIGVVSLGWLATTVVLLPAVAAQGQATTPDQSLSAWAKIVTVLQHPRCLNCHQLNSPLQGDTRRPHVPHVVRGPDNHGASAMRCNNCHSEATNNSTSRVPGAPHWQLAPAPMRWQDLSSGELCRVLKNPALNGNRSPQELLHHMETDRLVLWGWDPGQSRQPIPMPHKEFVDLLKVWVAGGSLCPA